MARELGWSPQRLAVELERFAEEARLEGIAAAHVILVPALAVDRSGTRLGQGGGSYDRALARRHPDALIAAVVNDDEYAAWPLPRDAHDVLVNAVITPGRGLTFIPGSGSVS